MKTAFALVLSAACCLALAQPASACPAGYESVWIQGNKVCKIKTPKFPLKTKEKRELGGATRTLKSR